MTRHWSEKRKRWERREKRVIIFQKNEDFLTKIRKSGKILNKIDTFSKFG